MTEPRWAQAAIHFHRFELRVEGEDWRIVRAIERRFAACGTGVGPPSERLRFVVRSVQPQAVPSATPGGRLVYESPRGRAYWYDDDDRLELESAVGHAICAPKGDLAELTVARDAEDAVWTASRPLFTLTLAELLKHRGVYFLHAGAVQVDDGAALFAGSSGSGKSTLAAALAVRGFPLLGDDSVFLDGEGRRVLVRSFPDELDLSNHSLELLGLDSASPSRLVGTEKWQLSVAGAGFVVGPDALPPRLLVLPSLGTHAPLLEEIDAEHAVLELMPNVLLTANETTARHLALLAELACLVPAFRLRSGPDLEATMRLLQTIL